MSTRLKGVLLGVLCASTTLSAMPPEVLAGPMSVAPPATVSLSAPTEKIYYYRRHYRPVYGVGYYRPRVHYRRYAYYYPRRVYYYGYPYGYYPAYYGYGYDPGGAIFAGAALGLMGVGMAAAMRPHWGYYGGWGWGGPGWWW
jgi:hypothetical protein